MSTASTLCAGLCKQGSGMIDLYLLVVSGVSSCWYSSYSKAKINPSKEIVTRYITSYLFSNNYYNKDN